MAYRLGIETVVDSSSLTHTVTMCRVRAVGCTFVDQFTSSAPGSNSFQYADNTWTLNMSTHDANGVLYLTGEYRLTFVPNNPGYHTGGPFTLVITR